MCQEVQSLFLCVLFSALPVTGKEPESAPAEEAAVDCVQIVKQHQVYLSEVRPGLSGNAPARFLSASKSIIRNAGCVNTEAPSSGYARGITHLNRIGGYV